MDIVVDSHTHTIASGHAYSTILENALAAKNKGLKLLCTTDHAPEMPGALTTGTSIIKEFCPAFCMRSVFSVALKPTL